MLVNVCLLLIYVLNLIQNARCSNLMQIDKLHLITPKMPMTTNNRKLRFVDQQPSISSLNYADERPASDQVASIQYELKIVQQKPLTTPNSQQSQRVEQTEDTVNVAASNEPSKQTKKEPKKSTNRLVHRTEENANDDRSTEQSALNKASAILKHYPSNVNHHNLPIKQLENHSYQIHHSYPQNTFPNFAQPSTHQFNERPVPEVKKIVHIHHYHHEHVSGEGLTKDQEKEQEKHTEKLVEKQVQEAVLKSFEEELKKEQAKRMRKRKMKGHNRKVKIFDEDQSWKPVKHSELIKKNGKRKASYNNENKLDEEDQDDAFSHQHQSKIARKKPKERDHYSTNESSKYSAEHDRFRHRKSGKSRYHRERPPPGRYRSEESSGPSSADDGDEASDDSFLKAPLAKDEEDYHRSQLESNDDYAFENDEHYVLTDSNRINKQSKLNDEESSMEVRKIGKKRHFKERKNDKISGNEKVHKTRIYDEKTHIEKVYNDKPIEELKTLNEMKSYNDKPYEEQLYREQLTDKPEILVDLMNVRLKQQHKLGKPQALSQQPLIELLDTTVPKRNPSMRRNWLGLELITKNN